MKDYYTILEVSPTASAEEIREQYLFLIQAWHPDKFGSAAQKAKAEEKTKQINIAYDVLRDSGKRADYDRGLKGQPARAREAGRQRPTPTERERKPAEEAPRPRAEGRRPRQAREETAQPDPAEEARRRLEQEKAEQEWIRVYFEQARRRQSGERPAAAKAASRKPIRVLIVDDLPDARTQLRDLLKSEAGFQVVGDAANGPEAVAQFDALMPDVMLTGINKPTREGFVATEAIRRKHPTSRVIILSVQSSTSNIREAAMLGACDYLTKPVRAEELRAAIHLAAGR